MTTICGGILPGTEEGWAEVDQRVIEQRAQDSEAAKRHIEFQALCDEIDAVMSPHLKAELAEVNKAARVSEKDKERFKTFQAACERWGFQALPAAPQALAVHLAEEGVHGAGHIERIARSICRIHRALQMSDPCTDVLVRALLLQARNEERAKRGSDGASSC
jgi:hypothetical protein